MTVVGTASLSAAIRDVSKPDDRARILARLRPHVSSFTEEEHRAYDQLRDVLLKIARGESTGEESQGFLDILAPYIEDTPEVDTSGVTVVHTEPNLVAETSVSAPVPSQGVTTQTEPVQVQSAVPSSTGYTIRGIRRGPDIATASAVPPETQQQLQDEPTPQITPPSAEAEQAPQTLQREIQIAPATSRKEPPNFSSLATLKERIETINDELNAFAHGTAFKWLSDTKTGYRTYLNELLLLRSTLSELETKAEKGASPIEEEYAECAERVSGLTTMAMAVRTAVGAEVTKPPVRVEQPAVGGEVTTGEGMLPSATTEGGELVASTDNADMTPVAELASQEVALPESLPENPMEIGGEEEMSEEATREESTPAVGEIEDVSANATEQMQSDITEVVPLSTTSTAGDPLFAKDIDAGLNELLVHWLGTTGFLGFGDSGVKHPDWLLMKGLYVEDVLTNDGVIPQGLRPDIYLNLGENLRSWKRTYALLEGEGETIEHFVRRIVDASMAKA